jgi:hypothetical protein
MYCHKIRTTAHDIFLIKGNTRPKPSFKEESGIFLTRNTNENESLPVEILASSPVELRLPGLPYQSSSVYLTNNDNK